MNSSELLQLRQLLSIVDQALGRAQSGSERAELLRFRRECVLSIHEIEEKLGLTVKP